MVGGDFLRWPNYEKVFPMIIGPSRRRNLKTELLTESLFPVCWPVILVIVQVTSHQNCLRKIMLCVILTSLNFIKESMIFGERAESGC